MAVKIRLRRIGKKRVPSYRVVVADGRSPRDGRFIEQIGRYDPLQDPSIVEIDNDRALDWLQKGAQPTDAVRKLLEISGAWGRFRAAKGEIHTVGDPVAPPPAKKKTSKKDRARAEAATEGDTAPTPAEAAATQAEPEPEPEAAATQAEPEPEPVAAATAEPEPEAAATQAEPEPEPVAAATAEPGPEASPPESDDTAPEPEESPTEEEQS